MGPCAALASARTVDRHTGAGEPSAVRERSSADGHRSFRGHPRAQVLKRRARAVGRCVGSALGPCSADPRRVLGETRRTVLRLRREAHAPDVAQGAAPLASPAARDHGEASRSRGVALAKVCSLVALPPPGARVGRRFLGGFSAACRGSVGAEHALPGRRGNGHAWAPLGCRRLLACCEP